MVRLPRLTALLVCASALLSGESEYVRAQSEGPMMMMGEDKDVCKTGQGPAILVTIANLKDRRGQFRMDLYSDDPDAWLAGKKKTESEGKTFRRIRAPLPPAGTPQLCVQVPGPGRYALFVLHDRDGDDKVGVFTDGFGFSRNPRLGFAKPKLTEVVFDFQGRVQPLVINLNYAGGGGHSTASQ